MDAVVIIKGDIRITSGFRVCYANNVGPNVRESGSEMETRRIQASVRLWCRGLFRLMKGTGA